MVDKFRPRPEVGAYLQGVSEIPDHQVVDKFRFFQKMLGLHGGVLVVGGRPEVGAYLQGVRQFLFFSEIPHHQVGNKFRFFRKMLGLYGGVLVVGA